MPKSTRHLTTALALLALAACHETSTPSAPPPPAPVLTFSRPSEAAPATAAAPANAAESEGPDSAADDDVPLGPEFPPARVTAPAPAEIKSFGDRIAYYQKWFKDAFPAGESRAVRFHSAADTDLSHQIKRNQAPEPLAEALAHSPKYPDQIARILERRNNNDTTKFLRMYLTANGARITTSAAEVVIENIFYGDRSPQAKCVEIGNDFEAIMQYGYFDEAVAARREYLQARLDQVYSRAQQPKDALSDAVVYVGVPVALAAVFGATGRALEHASERVAALRTAGAVNGALERGAGARLVKRLGASADGLLERAMARSAARSESSVEKLLQTKGMPVALALKGERLRTLTRDLAVGGATPKMEWRETHEPMLRYFTTRVHKGVELPPGREMLVFELKDGRSVHYATSNYLLSSSVRDAETFLAKMPPSTVMAMDARGGLHATDVSVAEIVSPRPRAVRLDQPSWSSPRVTEESGEIVDAVTAAAPTTPVATVTPRPRFNTAHALVGGTAGELSIMGVHKLGEITGRESEMNINALYLGGEIGNSVRPHPATKTRRPE